jgi:Shugoshin N-terminal coiled-coil region
MARLNETLVSSDSLETRMSTIYHSPSFQTDELWQNQVRRRLLRQNRDLAKSNNLRALKIRELENQCACMLSDNIRLRGRILELEKKTEDSEAQRIADHALAIKAQLEAQLAQWGDLISGLGVEPPPKRHSPSMGRTSTRRRTSFTYTKSSPSQRRLHEIAKDVEQLGHIAEHKAYSRRSMK